MLSIFKTISNYIADFARLFFPEYCVACESELVNQERILCTGCLTELPVTDFHKIRNNKVEQIFWGRVYIERATSLFLFTKESRYKNILHQLKYHNRKDIGIEMGKYLGVVLASDEVFSSVDFIIPVPLHKKKLIKRGYNQSEMIANGVSYILKVHVRTDILYRTVNTETQTKMSKEQRWENMRDVFDVKHSGDIENKHILLIDDVLTTGATLEWCALTLKKYSNVRISIATLAQAQL